MGVKQLTSQILTHSVDWVEPCSFSPSTASPKSEVFSIFLIFLFLHLCHLLSPFSISQSSLFSVFFLFIFLFLIHHIFHTKLSPIPHRTYTLTYIHSHARTQTHKKHAQPVRRARTSSFSGSRTKSMDMQTPGMYQLFVRVCGQCECVSVCPFPLSVPLFLSLSLSRSLTHSLTHSFTLTHTLSQPFVLEALLLVWPAP